MPNNDSFLLIILQDTPVHLHMLRNLVRSQKLGEGGEFRQSRMMEKSILRGAKVSQIKTVMAHHPSSCLNGMGSSCRRQQWVSPRVAILAHYREGCQATVSNVSTDSYTSSSGFCFTCSKTGHRKARVVRRQTW